MPALTENEKKYLIAGLQCLDGEQKLNVDLDKLAALLNLTNPRSAYNGWIKAWKKVTSGEVTPEDVKPKPSNNNKGSSTIPVKKRKRTAAGDSDIGDSKIKAEADG